MGQITSAERGVLVTMCGAVNVIGNAVPPFMIFPRVNMKDHMIKGAPPGTIGVTHKSGWMTGENCERWLMHFVTHCSVEKPVLLLMDNHDSHITVRGLDLAKTHVIVMVTFPPHCSHKLQPLDRTVYGPLKRYCNASCNYWQMRNPGKPMTIYDIAENLGEAFPRVFTPENITAGFKATGIWPFDWDVFSDDEFLSAYVTDRPPPHDEQQCDQDEDDVACLTPNREPSPSTGILQATHNTPTIASGPTPSTSGLQATHTTPTVASEPTPSTGSLQATHNTPTVASDHVSPHDVRPFPKAPPRKNRAVGRKKGQTLILTDTPVKDRIQGEIRSRRENKGKRSRNENKGRTSASEGPVDDCDDSSHDDHQPLSDDDNDSSI